MIYENLTDKQHVHVYVVSIDDSPWMVFTDRDRALEMTAYIRQKLPNCDSSLTSMLMNHSVERCKLIVDSLAVP